MKHIYTVTGMTCGGCRQSVEDALRSHSSVDKVFVNLDSGSAEIHSLQPIAIEELQGVLPEKYQISFQKKESNLQLDGTSEAPSKWKQLRPLLLILSYLIIAAVLLNIQEWDTSQFMMDYMGLFFIVFSFFKLLDLKGFPKSFAMYDPLAGLIPVYGWVYPFIEIALGLLFLMRIEVGIALIVTMVVLGITTIGVLRSLFGKKKIRCACLGTALNLPMTEATFIENAIMLIMSGLMLSKITL